MSYLEALSREDIEFGKRLWQTLRDSETFPVDGIFWLFMPEKLGWHLVVATPAVDQLGARDAYTRLAEVARAIQATPDQLLKVDLITPEDALYAALRSVFGHTASVEGARLGHTQVQGMYIDDAYLYPVQ